MNFDFPYCEDIGPFLLLSEIWPSFAPIFTGGEISGPVSKVIEAVGIRKSLRMNFPALQDLNHVWAMPVQRRRPRGSSASDSRHLDPQSRESVSDLCCDKIDEWLIEAETECELTDEARGWFKIVIGEILDNAERHSSVADADGSWTVAAFMARRVVDGVTTFACHMAFLSLGETFAESLDATAAPDLKAVLLAYVKEQREKRGAKQSRETLLTLAAMQDGITRDPRAAAENRGGTGLMDITDMVNLLAASDAGRQSMKIAIISGHSCILIRPPYFKGVMQGDNEPRYLWCNASNSRMEPPSPEHVFDLPVRLPGTVISLSFNLDPEYLRSTVNVD